jgi:cytochrome P450
MDDERQLVDRMLTFLLAGYETTATSLTWAFYHVLRHPNVQADLRAERRRVSGDGPLRIEHLGAVKYLDAVIKESARLTPITTDAWRLLKKPVRLGGIELPAGVIASASIYLTQHRPDLWIDPESFVPERFIDNRAGAYCYFPFGGGERRCLGAALAEHQMKVVLAQVLSRVELRLVSGAAVPRLRTFTVAPSRGVQVVMDHRSGGA